MCDYRCPACDGGFPAQNDPDQCPWCGETMAAPLGDSRSRRDPLGVGSGSASTTNRFLPNRDPLPRGFDRGRGTSTDPLRDDGVGLRRNGSANSLFDDDGFNRALDKRTGKIYRTTPSDGAGRTERLSNRLDEAREPEKADAAVAYLHDPDATMADVAEQFGRSQSWVSKAVQEYRDDDGENGEVPDDE